MRIILSVAMSLILAAAPAYAETDGDSQFWAVASAGGPLVGNVQLSLEGVLRFGDDADGLYEGEYTALIGYPIAEGVIAWAGYVHSPAYSRDGVTFLEQRAREQITADLGTVLGGKLAGRLRFEQRFRDTGDDTGHRFRPQLKWTRPLGESGIALVASHESFINFNATDWGQRSGYDRMRNFVGLNVPLLPGLRGEFGYLNQYGFGQDGRPDSSDDVASVSFGYLF